MSVKRRAERSKRRMEARCTECDWARIGPLDAILRATYHHKSRGHAVQAQET